MTRRSIKRASLPPAVREAQLKLHARLGSVSVLRRRLTLAVAEALREELAQGTEPLKSQPERAT